MLSLTLAGGLQAQQTPIFTNQSNFQTSANLGVGFNILNGAIVSNSATPAAPAFLVDDNLLLGVTVTDGAIDADTENGTASGLVIDDGVTVFGGIDNNDLISATSTDTVDERQDATAYAIRFLTGDTTFTGGIENSANGLIEALAQTDFGNSTAYGILVEPITAFAGGIDLQGEMDVQALTTFALVLASPTPASIGLDNDSLAEAHGIEVVDTSIAGDVLTRGSLSVTAKNTTSSINTGVSLFAVSAELAQAAIAEGVDLSGDLLVGSLLHEDTLRVTATASDDIAISTTGGGAQSLFRLSVDGLSERAGLNSSALGYGADFGAMGDPLGGDAFNNAGEIRAEATSLLRAQGTATGLTDGEVTFSDDGVGPAAVRAISQATGVRIGGSGEALVFGDIVNAAGSSIFASATATVDLAGTATGGEGTATSDVRVTASRVLSDSIGLEVDVATLAGNSLFSLTGDVINAGSISGLSNALLRTDATANAALDATAVSETFGTTQATAVGGRITAGTLFGNVEVAATGSYRGQAFSNNLASATASSTNTDLEDLATVVATARTGNAEADGTGLSVFAGALTGDVVIDGSVLGNARAVSSATTSVTGDAGAAFASTDATSGVASAEADGLVVGVGLMTGDVVNTSSDSIAARAAAVASATASASGGQLSVVSADAGDIEGDEASVAEAAGLTIAGEEGSALIGDLRNSGSILGQAETTVTASATSSVLDNALATASAADASAEGLGLLIAVDLMTGEVVNQAGGEIAGVALASQTLTASATATGEGNASAGALIRAGAVDAHADGVGVTDQVTALNKIGNAGLIAATASATLAANATMSANGIQGSAVVAFNAVTAAAHGVVVETGGVVFGIENSGTVVADATASRTGAATSNNVGEGDAAVFFAPGDEAADRAYAEADAILVTADLAFAGGIRNSGTLTATAKSTTSATATSTTDAPSDSPQDFDNGASVDLGATEADADGIEISVTDGLVAGGVLNSTPGVIQAAATATRVATVSQVSSTADGTAAASLLAGEILASSNGIDLEGPEEDSAGLATLLGGIDNAGLIQSQATATSTLTATASAAEQASARLEASGTSTLTPLAEADGIDVAFTDSFGGGIANSGRITATATAGFVHSASATTTTGGDGQELASADANVHHSFAGNAIATGIEVTFVGDSALASLSGEVVNSGRVDATAGASTAMTATATSGTGDSAATSEPELSTRAIATGIDLNLQEADFPDAVPGARIEDAIINAGSGIITATATATLQETATAAAALDAAANSGSDTGASTAIATATGLSVDASAIERLENAGLITVVAKATRSATSTATSTDGNAFAFAGQARSSGSAYGVFLLTDAVASGVENSGGISATAETTTTITASAEGDGEGSAGVNAQPQNATADAIRISLSDFDETASATFSGGFRNSGTLQATAKAVIVASATSTVGDFTPEFGDPEGANTAAGVIVKADGAYISVNGSFDGGVVNVANAAISAASTATVTQTATTTAPESAEHGTAVVVANLIVADSDGIDLEGRDDPLAQPILITVFTGGVANHGTIAASAAAQATGVASTSGADGTASVTSRSSFNPFVLLADSAAIDVAVSEALHGGLLNDATLQSISRATRSNTATATVEGTASATASGEAVASFSRGIEFDANTADAALLDGGASNGGSIDVRAFGTVTTTATATGESGSAQLTAGFLTVSAQGIDLDLTGKVDVFDEELQDFVTLPVGGSIEGNVVNANGAIIQAQATGAMTSVASGSTSALATITGGLTEAIGISVDTLSITGDVRNAGSIVAQANGPHSTTVSGKLSSGLVVTQDTPDFESLAQGLYLIAGEMVGDFTNAGSIVASATERGTVSATTLSEEALFTLAQDRSRAAAHGLQLKSPSFDGDFANLAGGAIDVDAVASSTVTISAASGNLDTVAQSFVTASAAGLDAQPDSPLDPLDEDSVVGFVPLAAYDLYTDPAAPGLLTGRFDNLGTLSVTATASALVTFTVASGPHLARATTTAVAQGMGSSMQTIQGGVGNWGTIAASASADAALNTAETSFDGNATRAALAYGILLVAPQAAEEVPDQFPIQAEPTALGLIGDADGDGVSVENHGYVGATAAATATGGSSPDIQGGPGTSYAAALQIGRLSELTVALNAFTGKIPLPPDYAGGDGMVLSGDLLNTGTLYAKATAPLTGPSLADMPTVAGVGLYHSVVEGSLDNSGPAAFIVAEAAGPEAKAYGIVLVDAIVEGGINTSGLIMATASGILSSQADAINTVQAAGATVINVLDGIGANEQLSPEDNPLWTGDNLVGIVGDIRLAEGFGDTVNWSGGDIQGDILGSPLCGDVCAFDIAGGDDDVLNVFAGLADVFDYDGLINGLLAINVNTAEHAGTPVELTFRGLVEQTTRLNVNDNGTLVLGKAYEGFFDAGLIQVGEYNHAAGGTVLFEIDGSSPGDSGYIVADGIVANSPGALNIAGGLIGIRPTGAFFADEATYEVIYASSRNGAFAGTTSPTPLLQVTVEYGDYDGAPGAGKSGPGDVHDVTDFDSGDSDVRLHVTRVPFDEVGGLTPNQKAVASAIENVFGPDLEGTEFGDGIAFLFLTDDYQEALSQLHGAEHAQTANLVGQLSGLFSQWLADRKSDGSNPQGAATQSYAWSPALDQIAAAKELDGDADAEQVAEFARGGARTAGSFSVWFGGGGLWGEADSDPSQDVEGFDQRTWGGMAGIDYQVDSQFLVGLAGLYQTTTAEFDDNSDSDIDSFQVGLYGTWDTGTLYVDALASVGWSSIDTERRIEIPSVFEGTAKGDTDAFLLTLGAEVGYAFRFDGGFSVTPLAGLDYRHASIDGYDETGASPYNLSIDDNDVDSLSSTLGFAIGGDFDLGGMKLSPELRAAWQHEFLDSQEDITASFVAEPGASFTAVGSDFGSDAGLVGAGLTLEVQPGIEAFVDYNGRFSGGYSANAVSGGLRLSW